MPPPIQLRRTAWTPATPSSRKGPPPTAPHNHSHPRSNDEVDTIIRPLSAAKADAKIKTAPTSNCPPRRAVPCTSARTCAGSCPSSRRRCCSSLSTPPGRSSASSERASSRSSCGRTSGRCGSTSGEAWRLPFREDTQSSGSAAADSWLVPLRGTTSPWRESTVRCPSPVGRPEGHSGCRTSITASSRPIGI